MQAESLVDLAEMAMNLRLGQMSRQFDADLSLAVTTTPRKFCRPCSRGPNYELCLARQSIIAGSPVGEPPMDQWPGDLRGCLA
jgi:hypothetical protein